MADESTQETRELEPQTITVELIKGVEGLCIGINDYRICGPKPWGGGTIERSWKTTRQDVLAAFLTPDEKHNWLAQDLTVVPVNSHAALTDEVTRLREALEQLCDAVESRDALSTWTVMLAARAALQPKAEQEYGT